MRPRSPLAQLPTHEVTNMPPHLGDQDLWASDKPLRVAVNREGGSQHAAKLQAFGKLMGTDDQFLKAEQANKFSPEMKSFDRYGMRVNQVEYHPAYHDLMATAISNEIPSFAWNNPGQGGHVTHMALTYIFSQVEGGVLCPMAMTYSAIPSLRMTPAIADEWIPRLRSTSYDPRDIPVQEKSGATMGMFMTEKQGGSDVRANSSVAVPLGAATGPGAEYLLSGHKFFCSAPMCDAFLVLAYTDAGLSCFLVPRWKPDGERNNLFLQRLKDKLGNKSNASSEMEFQDTYGIMLGEDGLGIRCIMEMVTGNRLYCSTNSAGLMRQALVQALHHTRHRSAFQKRLAQQPLMQNVLADLALEAEAALALSLRIARAMDESPDDPSAAAFARIGTTVAKYWNCKRAPSHIVEALECLGGSGYIEDSMMPRLYREAPLNGIWEGSGNIMCLDVLRAMFREEAAVPAFLTEVELGRGANTALDSSIDLLKGELVNPQDLEIRARSTTELMATTLQGSLLVRHAPKPVADAFCASRLSPRWSGSYGTLPSGTDFDAIIERALPN